MRMKKITVNFYFQNKKQILITAVPYNTRHLLAYVIFKLHSTVYSSSLTYNRVTNSLSLFFFSFFLFKIRGLFPKTSVECYRNN